MYVAIGWTYSFYLWKSWIPINSEVILAVIYHVILFNWLPLLINQVVWEICFHIVWFYFAYN